MSAVPDRPPSEAPEPDTFGAYRLGDVVASDLVTVTYRAAPTTDGRHGEVALRLVADRVQGNTRAVRGFLHVNQRIAEVDHPHVLPVVEVGTQRTPFVATAWREGLLLADLLLEHAPVDVTDALRLCGQVAEALDTTHANGIVHGTVGLPSVWIKRRPGGRTPPAATLTGFGTSHLLAPIVHEVEDDEAHRELLFVAPEQLRGEPAGPAADQYALACMLFTMVTGTTPFRGETNNDLFGAHLFSEAPAASAVRAGLEGWDEVFARALAKDPDERFENCRTLMLAAGRAQVRRQPPPPRPEPVPVHVEEDEAPRDRRWLRLVLLVLLVLTLAAVAVGLSLDVGGAVELGGGAATAGVAGEPGGGGETAAGTPGPSIADPG